MRKRGEFLKTKTAKSAKEDRAALVEESEGAGDSKDQGAALACSGLGMSTGVSGSIFQIREIIGIYPIDFNLIPDILFHGSASFSS